MQKEPPKLYPIKAVHDLARRNKIIAEYQLEKESGPDHAKLFTVQLRLGEKQYTGVDRSIKLAQRAAAQIALDDHKHLLPINHADPEINMSQSPTVALNTWAAQHHILTKYVLLDERFLPSSLHMSKNRPHIIFYYRLYFGQDLYFDGHGSSHQQARINCAFQALHFIQQNQMSPMTSSTQIQPKSQVSLMYERAKQLGLSVRLVQNESFTITYHIGEQYSATGTGSTKHAAKQIAAEKMLEILPLPIEKQTQKHNHPKHSNQRKKFIEQKGSNNYSLSEEINPIARLYQIARANTNKIEFIHLQNPSNEKLFHFHVKFGENDVADGYGKSKQAAKRSAAENLLIKLNPDFFKSISISLPPPPTKGLLKRDENSNKQQEKKHVHFLEDEKTEVQHRNNDSNQQSSITMKQQLTNACDKLNIHIQFVDQLSINDENQYESILSLSKDDRLLAQFRSQATTVISAQESVSTIAWKNLQQLFNGSIEIPKATVNKRYRQVQMPISLQQE